MQELVAEYKNSIKLLKIGITRLENRCRYLDPNDDMTERYETDLRLMKIMLNDLTEVKNEVEHYYDRSWWRSETLTCNSRKRRRYSVYIR